MANENEKKKRRRRFGDRSDGRRLRTLSPITRVGCYIMPTRSGALNSIHETVDVAEADKYIKEKKAAGLKNFSFMHVILAAYVRTASQLPAINRFVSGREIYAHNDMQISLTIKKEMTLESPDTVIKIVPPLDSTAEDVYKLITDEIENYRNEPGGGVDKTAKILNYMPGLVMAFAVKTLRFLDYFGLIPKKLLDFSPFHGSMYITSLGSLGIPPAVHHLYDFGNCPVFIAFGAKERKYVLNSDDVAEKKDYIDFTVTLDERICDGYYFARALKKLMFYLRNPWLLDTPPEEVVEDID